MKHRLYLPEPGAPEARGLELTLTAEQAHYLGRVLRLGTGAEIGLFDGRGTEWRARLSLVTGREARAEIVEQHRSEPPPAPLVLAQAWLKGSAMDTVVQKAVELGATEIWLVRTDRSNVKVDGKRMAGKLAHLARIAISAAEQCETLWLPHIDRVDSLAGVLERSRPGISFFLDPGQPPLKAGGKPGPVTLMVGPEGGWSEMERQLALADATVTPAGLGPLVLRAETAPLAALAAIRQDWGWRRAPAAS